MQNLTGRWIRFQLVDEGEPMEGVVRREMRDRDSVEFYSVETDKGLVRVWPDQIRHVEGCPDCRP
ncbi:hypothetical protein [Actinomadura miaoliensis]|uniref:DUF1918 domain-containing protein n=1 Tax=Actinomadura miaoliensis TaxID=430685 RepID=A0ABP7WBF9_9ACTN